MLETSIKSIEGLAFMTHVGSYRFEKMIFKGKQSIVNLVFHPVTSQYYCMKIIPKELYSNIYSREFIENEIEAHKRLQHQNILSFIESFEDISNFYIITDYCSKGNLAQFISKNGAMSEGPAKEIFRQVLEAVSYIHESGFAHRDIKPDNILIDSKFNIKLADLGFSIHVTEGVMLNSFCGSLYYAAPEVLEGIPYNGIYADMWSLGIVLFSLLTGSLPWTATNDNHIAQQIKSCAITIPDYLNPCETDLLNKLLNKDPQCRISCKEALQHNWITNKKSCLPPLIPTRHRSDSESSSFMRQMTYMSKPQSAQPSNTSQVALCTRKRCPLSTTRRISNPV